MDELARIKSLIYEIRGVKVMLDKDLAELYHVCMSSRRGFPLFQFYTLCVCLRKCHKSQNHKSQIDLLI